MSASDKNSSRIGIRPIELFIPEIKQMLETRSWGDLKDVLHEINAIDLADGFNSFSPEQQLLLFKLLRPSRMMGVFEELELDQQEYILQHLDDETLAPLIENTADEVTAKLFKKLPPKAIKRMTNVMNRERLCIVEDLMDYPPKTVGAIMRTNFLNVPPSTTAKAARALLQARTRVRIEEEINMIFVTNGNRRLLGGIPLRTLIAAPGDIKVKDIMSAMSPIRIPVSMNRQDASEIFTHYKILSAPVVDENGRLVGVLAADDVIEVIKQESTEDIQKLGAVQALEAPYFQTHVFQMVKKRAPWLSILFLGQTLTATAMGFFENQIARAAVLALFIPLVISSGGNSGSQAATLIVRALSLKEITFRDWLRVMERELISGLTLGVILGSLGFAGIFCWGHFSHIYGPYYFLVAVSVGLALIMIVMWGSVMGSLLPILLKKMGLDPAVASAPFVATLVDVTGLLIYFSVAAVVLRGTLL